MSGGGNVKNKFGDEKFTIFDSLDKTKKLVFEVEEISTATTRTITMPDEDIDLGDMVQISGSLVDFAVVCGDGGGTGVQSVSGVGTSSQVLTSNGAGSLPTWQAASGGQVGWSVETGTSATLVINSGVFANNASLVTFTLPTTAALGDIVNVIGMGAGLFKIAQNASEDISFPGLTTTAGTGGSITSQDQYCSLELICNVANTNWIVKSSTGQYTVV